MQCSACSTVQLERHLRGFSGAFAGAVSGTLAAAGALCTGKAAAASFVAGSLPGGSGGPAICHLSAPCQQSVVCLLHQAADDTCAALCWWWLGVQVSKIWCLMPGSFALLAHRRLCSGLFASRLWRSGHLPPVSHEAARFSMRACRWCCLRTTNPKKQIFGQQLLKGWSLAASQPRGSTFTLRACILC